MAVQVMLGLKSGMKKEDDVMQRRGDKGGEERAKNGNEFRKRQSE